MEKTGKKKFLSPVMVQHPLGRAYDSMEFSLADGQTDYDVKANVTGAFENLLTYTTINLRTTKDITVKLNSTSNRAITVSRARSAFDLDNMMEITNIYITNASGATASIKIIGVLKGG